ncbi:hypothetical protein EV363DRAFT_1167944 [Boletus edulis]|nr:hypothetical protein EV363DRAFT_1167944 [Boletus edulis]
MGPTGSGKTNVRVFSVVLLTQNSQVKTNQLINKLTGNAEQRKAGLLESDTKNVTPYPISHHGRRVVLVDTPGFDDTYRPDSEILKLIADWLIQKYQDGTTLKIAGILYMHRITDNFMSGSAYKNLQIFSRLCGDLPLHRARLVMSMWDRAKDREMAAQRETQLTDNFWRVLIDEGAVARRFYNSSSSAWGLVDELLCMVKDFQELLVQEELVEQRKHLNETEAAKVIYSRLQKDLAEQKKTLKELAGQAKLQNDPNLAKILQDEHDRMDVQVQKTMEQIKEIKISLSRRLLLWMSGQKSRAVSPAHHHVP